MDLTNKLQNLLAEEDLLSFTSFSNLDAFHIARLIIEEAESKTVSIVIHIVVNKQVIFHYAFPGTTPDNDRWIAMKANVVNLYQHSSYYMELFVKKSGLSPEEALCLPQNQYSASGGCYPIRLKNGVMIGHISVSGYTAEEDHCAVIRALRNYLRV